MEGDRTSTAKTREGSLKGGSGSSDGRTQPARRPRRSARRRALAVAVALILVVPGFSYVQALTYPGSATWQMRSVEWLRDHGGSPVVDRIENWYYTSNLPSGSAPARAALPAAGAARGTSGRSPVSFSPAPPVARHPALPGEGIWVPGRLDPSGVPAIYTSFFRPDPHFPSVVAGAAWIRAGHTTAHLVAGTREPGGAQWPGGARVAPADVPRLVATFNSGWKMSDAAGGFYLLGRSTGSLLSGQASLVIDTSGAATVGQWARDVRMTSRVAAVRQNLALIVDNHRPVNGLSTNAGHRWGSFENQGQYTWRSGVGVDAAGDLIYVTGENLTLQTLATAMADVGVVRGMELDIHSALVSFASWAPTPTGVVATKLLPGMDRPADRYLAADQRDFFYLTLR
jgi:hypothetical protein